MIEGQPDFFVVITATQGSPVSSLVTDHMELSIVSGQGELQLTEKIYWANFTPSRGTKVHFYGEGLPNSKLGEMPIDDGHGRKRFAKMYIADLDQDNQLDILFWFKTFRSTAYSEAKGFRFEKESFALYRENDAQNGFEAVTVDNEKGLALLQANQLAWENGYPYDTSMCRDSQKNRPLMDQIVD